VIVGHIPLLCFFAVFSI